jgi:hypothetical protein
MPGIRGRTPGVYISDGGTNFRTSVDRDRFAVADFGWTAAAATLNAIPRGCIPRHVTGLSATSGRRGTAVVPDVTSDIWTGTATTFVVEADDGTNDTMTVIHRIAERPSLS